MRKKISEISSAEHFDVIYSKLIRSAQYLDSITLYLSRFVEVTNNPIKENALKIELKRIIEYERIANKFDSLFICSENDKDFLEKKNLYTNICFLKNGVSETFFQKEN